MAREKDDLLEQSVASGNPADDLKRIAGSLYVAAKKILGLRQSGNDAEAFAISTLAPLITPDTDVYAELKASIFGGPGATGKV